MRSNANVRGCGGESDRRRKLGSGSLNARERYVRIGGQTQNSHDLPGSEAVHRLGRGVQGKAPAPAGEQLRETYTGRYAGK